MSLVPRAVPLLGTALLALAMPLVLRAQAVTRYVRFETSAGVAYGIVEGDRVQELSGDYFSNPRRTGRSHALSEVQLLAPVEDQEISKVEPVRTAEAGALRLTLAPEQLIPFSLVTSRFPDSGSTRAAGFTVEVDSCT